MTCRASSPPECRPSQGVLPLRNACSSTGPDPPAPPVYWESSLSQEAAFCSASSLALSSRATERRAGASPSILRKWRRPGCIAKTRSLIFSHAIEKCFKRAGLCIHACVRIAELCVAFRNGEHGEVGRIADGNLMPVKRRGHASVRSGPDRISRARRAVLGILVVVEKYPVPFFFPPL